MIADVVLKVRYSETDKMGVVYHANYLSWFDVARTEYLDKLGYPYVEFEESGYMAPVADANIRYISPLRFGEVAVVRTCVTRLTGATVTFSYKVYRQGQDFDHDKPCITGFTRHAIVHAETFKPTSLRRANSGLFQAYKQALEEDF